ncbi:hypothetical protein O0I10_007503 [Lichtheimia ornata]|uniref:Uncharacterized protein n=1 Tax=Lichtheimia ornata TaxID=688661 RepID=A0AAD7V3B0_9FUNG|nr:uncharacterized protein O0I10_007503 [Lichtheimia ornata]KAJ8656906.1 hypothetical protein O0I10_007503 [Lichtheimia ornata]
MAKRVISNPAVFNIITRYILNCNNDYDVGNCEWSDGSRSDIVLVPKATTLDLPPLIIEIQQRVDVKFMKRVIKYALEAYKRYQRDPIILIICVDTVHDDVMTLSQPSDVTGCVDIPCALWASKCILACDESLKSCNQVTPLQPFISLCLFFTKNAPSINDTCWSTDTTMQLLYGLAKDHYDSIIGNEQHLYEALQQTIEEQQREYNSLRDMIARQAPMNELESIIITAQERNATLKRKYDQMTSSTSDEVPSSDQIQSQPSNSTNTEVESQSETMFQKAMAYVDDFAEKRRSKGYTQMDWVTCYNEGTKAGIFDYKNKDVLRSLYTRYTKDK